MKRLDIVGQRFGKLMVLENLHSNKDGLLLVKCKCDCGNEKIVSASRIKRGDFKSCGCNQFPTTTKSYRNHPLYDVWKGMIARCENKNHVAYKNYGGRGVIVCKEWRKDFLSFYTWAIDNGWEQGLQIDKDIKASKMNVPPLLYSPEMCSIVTRSQNARVTRKIKINDYQIKEIRALKVPQKTIAKMYSVNVSTIQKIKSNS